MATAAPTLAAPVLWVPTRKPIARFVWICLGLAGVVAAAAIFAPLLAPHDPVFQRLTLRLRPPWPLERSIDGYWLGTDQLGRDLLARLLYGLRTTLGIAAASMAIGLLVGAVLGLAAGFARGKLDLLIATAVDVQLAVPVMLLALTAIAMFGKGVEVLVVVMGLAYWEHYARLVRGQVLVVRELPYIEACTALGLPWWRTVFRHVLPNVASPLIVMATLNFNQIVLLESALSFLGLGVKPPQASLGSMVGTGRDYMASSWWVVAVPAAGIVVVALLISFIGDWLRDHFDARTVD